MKIKCSECGKTFKPGTRPDGLPNGVGFVLEDGSTLNVCAECIIKAGMKARIENKAQTCYAILVKQDNPFSKLTSDAFTNLIKRNKGAIAATGYDIRIYVTCIVCRTRLDRDRIASSLDQMGIDYDVRDDAYL